MVMTIVLVLWRVVSVIVLFALGGGVAFLMSRADSSDQVATTGLVGIAGLAGLSIVNGALQWLLMVAIFVVALVLVFQSRGAIRTGAIILAVAMLVLPALSFIANGLVSAIVEATSSPGGDPSTAMSVISMIVSVFFLLTNNLIPLGLGIYLHARARKLPTHA